MLLDESLRELLTLNTNLRLFKTNSISICVKSATWLFQRAIENKVRGLKYTIVRVDGILAGVSENLQNVFGVLKGNGLRQKKRSVYS